MQGWDESQLGYEVEVLNQKMAQCAGELEHEVKELKAENGRLTVDLRASNHVLDVATKKI